MQTLADVEAGKKAREPVGRVLQEVKAKTKVNFKLLHRLVDYQLFDIERGNIMTIEELEIYAENTRSLMLYMNLHLLQVDNVQVNLAASHLGRALGICDVIKKTPYYLAMQRGYIPNDLMIRHNVFYDRVYEKIGNTAKVVEEFYDVLLELASYAKKHLMLA